MKFGRNLAAFCALIAGAACASDTAEGLEFFEKSIRPVLVDRCYKCHSAKSEKLKGGLLVDSRAGLLKGGETGPAIVPGDVEKSLLIKAIRYKDDNMLMPPKGALASAEVANFEAWVKMGAPDPRTGSVANTSGMPDINSARSFWAFQQPKLPPLPKLKQKKWAQTPIDQFVLAKLDEKKLKPATQADRRTLIRRAAYALTGLPPTVDEVDSFVNDKSPEAYAKLIDRLLASPHYGERWGRYWLDIARYSDTKGYVFTEERRYPYSYTYRDWVVKALNDDLPYDKFLIQQIAADGLPEKERQYAAMGFLTLGRRFLNNQADIIDDRIDVVSRGTLGLTVSCARCHDHKFDPIPTKDYYSLYGIFASSEEPKDLPLIEQNSNPETTAQFEKELKAAKDNVQAHLEKRHKILVENLRSKKSISDYLQAAQDAAGDEGKIAKDRDLSRFALGRWREFLKSTAKSNQPVMAPWHALAAIPEKEFTARASDTIKGFAGKPFNPLIVEALTKKTPVSRKELADMYGELLSQFNKPEKLADANQEALRQILHGNDTPTNVPLANVENLFQRDDRDKTAMLRKIADGITATHPGAPARAMALVDSKNPHNTRVFIRGKQDNQGPEAQRQFLGILSKENREPFKKGSGRLELAQSIASRENPLTARVMVNRVWQHHFGVGLVTTPSDFGLRSSSPSNPELLDFLAVQFMDDGWSLKKLHRAIMLSSVYQQSSDDNIENRKIDPENVFLWRMNRQRLDFEAMRDSLLAVTGKLDQTFGGRGVELTTRPFTSRRTIYGIVERQNLPNLFRTFDFASPDTHSPQRFNTTVPQQALFMMNSPFVIEQAKRVVERPEIATEKDPEKRIRQIYRTVFERIPSKDEIELGLRFIRECESKPAEGAPAVAAVWKYGYGKFDGSNKRLTEFKPLPHFSGGAWQGGKDLPDPKIGWVMLTNNGGHPGDSQHAAVRRWTSPIDGTVSVSGKLAHASKDGDGIAGYIMGKTGVLGAWSLKTQDVETKVAKVAVAKGDVIDFIVDSRSNVNSDSFEWAPKIRATDSKSTGGRSEWNALDEFEGVNSSKPADPLNAWERYAHVLMESNEFMFVD